MSSREEVIKKMAEIIRCALHDGGLYLEEATLKPSSQVSQRRKNVTDEQKDTVALREDK